MEDIEDAVRESDVQGKPMAREASVIAHSSSARKDLEGYDETKEASKTVPGTQKVWLKTYGCSHNVSDSEYMEGLLTKYGYEMVGSSNEADVWVVNSCTVKDPSQAAFMHLVQQAKDQSRPIVVAGCVSQADRSLKGLEDVSMLGVTQIDRVVEAVEQTLQGHTIKLLAKKALPQLDLPKIRKNPLVEIIPLSTGCLGACTYCKTRQARGKLGSYSPDAIVSRAQSVLREGVAEIWLSSEDTGAYGLDIGTDIAQLLTRLTDPLVLPPDSGVMLRIGMTNPPYILTHLETIARILSHPNVYAFIHIPVQAGSDVVLEGMNREYTVAQFTTIADYLLAHVPGVTIATDIICGFPNESEEDFDQTLALIGKYRFAIVNISQFYPRPGTVAAKMKRIATQIVKNRSRRLTTLFESFTPYVEMQGKEFLVWFNIEVSDDKQHSVGHTKAYVKVLVPFDLSLPGTCYKVEVVSTHRFHVVGRIVSEKLYDVSRNRVGLLSAKKSLGENVGKGGGGQGRGCGAEDCCGGEGDCEVVGEDETQGDDHEHSHHHSHDHMHENSIIDSSSSPITNTDHANEKQSSAWTEKQQLWLGRAALASLVTGILVWTLLRRRR